jgi:hypothetical protein
MAEAFQRGLHRDPGAVAVGTFLPSPHALPPREGFVMETLTASQAATLPVETDASRERMKRWPVEVKALLAFLAKPRPGANRRKRPRIPLRLEVVLEFRSEHSGATIDADAYSRDISGEVIGFLTQNPPKPGQAAVLKFDDAEGVTRRMPCRVVRCRQIRDGWFEGTVDLSGKGKRAVTSEGQGLWRKVCAMLGAA